MMTRATTQRSGPMDTTARRYARHALLLHDAIALPIRPWQGPKPHDSSGWGDAPRVRIDIGPDGTTHVDAARETHPLMERLGGRPLALGRWRWHKPGIALALWPILAKHTREMLRVDNACKERDDPPTGPSVFALRSNVEQIGPHVLPIPLERGYACLIEGGHRAMMRAAGWFYHAYTGLWHARSLHACAAFAAYAEPMVRKRLRARGVPSSLFEELRHAPALIPWAGRKWHLIANTSKRAALKAPSRYWRGGKGGVWHCSSTTTAIEAGAFAPRTLALWLAEGRNTHALEGVNAGTFTLTCPEAVATGAKSPPDPQTARPLVWCRHCEEVVCLAPLPQGERFQTCTESGCEAASETPTRETQDGKSIVARRALATGTALRLRDRGLATPAAWRAIAWSAAEIDIAANELKPPAHGTIEGRVPQGLELRPEQAKAIHHALTHRIAINAATTGAGKTIAAAMVLNVLLSEAPRERALIVAKASLIDNWARELGRWLDTSIGCTVGRTHDVALPDAGVALCSYERMQRWPALHAWCAQGTLAIVITDEGHAAKNARRKRTKALMALPTRRRLILSATPITNQLTDVQPILGALSPAAFGNAAGFAAAYRIRDMRAPTADEEAMSQTLGEALRTSGVLYRPNPKDVLGDLPKMLPEKIVVVDIEDGKRLGAEEAALESRRTNTHATPTPEQRMSVLAELARLRETIGRAKVSAMHAQLEALTGVATLVFAHHHSVVDALRETLERLGHAVETIHGERTQDERTRAVDRFQRGEAQVLVLTMGAGGEGLNLPRAERILIAELDWGPVAFAQAIGRAQRPGRTTALEVRYIIARDTLDIHMAQTVVGKAHTIAQALGDDTVRNAPDASRHTEQKPQR